MSSLTEVTQALLEQNKTLRGVETGISALVKEQVAERVMSERQKLRNEEARRENQRRAVGSPTSVTQGIKQGAKEGLGLGLLGGIAGFLTSAIGSIIPGIGVGGLAAAGAALVTKFLVRGAMVGLLAKFGQDVLEGLINKLDPNEVFLDKDAQSKFATGLNFSLMGGLIAKTVGSLFGKRFGRLFGVAGLIGGFLYPYFNNMIDDTKLEKAFNEKFDIDFGADIIAGIGSLIAGTLATVLSGRLLNMIRMKLGIGPAQEGPSKRGRGGSLFRGGGSTAGTVSGGVAPRMEFRGYDTPGGREKFARKVHKMSPKTLERLGFSRTSTGALMKTTPKGPRFASLEQVAEAVSADKAAKVAKYMKALRLLGAAGLAAEAVMIANMAAEGASDEEIRRELAGLLGSVAGGAAGAYIGGAIGSVILPGYGTVGGAAIVGLAGIFGGEWVGETLANAMLGLPQGPLPTQFSIGFQDPAIVDPTTGVAYGPGVTAKNRQSAEILRQAKVKRDFLNYQFGSPGMGGAGTTVNIGQVGDNVQSTTTTSTKGGNKGDMGRAVDYQFFDKHMSRQYIGIPGGGMYGYTY